MNTPSDAELSEIKIEIALGAVESINELLVEFADERWSLLEDVILHRAWILGIFESVEQARDGWVELSPSVGSAQIGPPEIRSMPEREWRDSYKAHFHPWQFGRLHWVPVWERDTFKLPEGDTVLWLDPGMAFGTGNHETTRLCVERLVQHAAQVGTKAHVVDAGCGSGILALSAARLGFNNVIGFDSDIEAVRVSEENAALNGLTDAVRFFLGDLQTGLAVGRADILLANILANVLLEFREALIGAIAPGGRLILSGILATECMQVRDTYRACAPDWTQETRTLGEWSDVVLTRPQHSL